MADTRNTDYDRHDHDAVMSMISGHWVSQIVRTLAAMRVPELLHERAHDAEEISTIAETNSSATFRLLRAATAIGLLHAELADGQWRFQGTARLDRLRADAPDSLCHLAQVWNEPNLWLPWGRLPDAVKSGQPQVVEALGETPWEYFERHPAEAELFGRGVTELSAPVIREVVEAITLSQDAHIVDVGGANGLFALSLLEQHPDATGVVLDLAHTLNAAQDAISTHGMPDRCQALSGDFFESVPVADVYLLKFILHDWDDASCVQILNRCRQAMRPDGRVIVVDMVCGDVTASGLASLMDLNMLVNLPGRERDEKELDGLLDQAGLHRVASHPLSAGYRLIEAVAYESTPRRATP